jgi:p-aminobenzoyl-glutamate transporter AbgT
MKKHRPLQDRRLGDNIVPTIILIGILGSLAGDAATVILPPLAAMIFIKVHSHIDLDTI